MVLRYDLNGPERTAVHVTERLRPADSGWTREVQVSGLPEGWRPIVAFRSPEGREKGDSFRWQAGDAGVELLGFRLAEKGEPAGVSMEPEGMGNFRVRLQLRVTPAF